MRLAQAADNLPTAWRTGIATNYGGAQDGMVSCNTIDFISTSQPPKT